MRDSSAALLAARTTEVQSFRLTLVTPMGSKRSGLKGAFVPGLIASVEGMYRDVVQPIKPWTPTAPKLSDESQTELAAVVETSSAYEGTATTAS